MRLIVRGHADEWEPPFTRVDINRGFVDEWRQIEELTHAYGSVGSDGAGGDGRRFGTRRHRRHVFPRGLRPRIVGWVFRCREPLTRTVMKGRCPDCGRRLAVEQGLSACRSCRTSFLVR